MSGYDNMARHVRDALEESEVQEDGSCIIRPEHYLQLNADFEVWDEADDARLAAAPKQAEQQGVEFPRETIARLCLSALFGFEFTGESLCDEADRIFTEPNPRAVRAVALADRIAAALNAPTGAVEKGRGE